MSKKQTAALIRQLQSLEESPNVEDYVALHNHVALYALRELINQVENGSTSATIELFKRYSISPKINNYYELSQLPGLSRDEMQTKMAQLQMRMKNNNFKEITVESVRQAWLDDVVSRGEHDALIEMIRMTTQATRKNDLSGSIEISLIDDVERVLLDDIPPN